MIIKELWRRLEWGGVGSIAVKLTPIDKDCGTCYFRSVFALMGFTSTSIWIDPGTGLTVVPLTNRVCPVVVSLQFAFHARCLLPLPLLLLLPLFTAISVLGGYIPATGRSR